MKRSIMVAVWISAFANSFAQSTEDGIKALDYENFETAKRIFTQLIKQNPADGKNYYYLGESLLALGNADSARIVFTAGSQADSKTIHNYIGLGHTYLDQNNVQKANEQFDKAKSLTSQKDINLYLLLADAYTNSTHPNCQQSINLLNKAIEYNNKSADVYWELGNANECLSKGGDAVSAYERAGELNATFAKAYTRVGVIWRLARNYNQSLASFQKALTADPNFPPAYREMAELYFYTSQFDKATETYQKYLDLADKNDYTQLRYAKFKFLTKDYEGTLDILASPKSKIDDPIIERLTAYSAYELGNYEEALAKLTNFMSRTDTSRHLSSDYEYMGKLLAKKGQDSLAMINYRKAIALDTTRYTLYTDIGAAYFQAKKYHEAAEAYQEKVDAAPKEATLQDYFNVGKSYYFAKEFLEADSAFATMGQLNKAWPISYFWRARVMTNLDNPDSIKGLAAPFYHAMIEKAMADTNKYKKELIEAYKYLGDINALKENYGAAMYYYNKYLALEPGNPDVLKTVESVKALYKSPTTGSVPLQKDSSGMYLIPATLNTTSASFVYDAGVQGFAVTPEHAAQLFGSADGRLMVVAEKITIANRDVKNPEITISEGLAAPAMIGGYALNQFNIVLDYASGSLLLR